MKQLFHAFINRSIAYSCANQIGLVLFSTTPEYVCPLTSLYERFREEVDAADRDGDTAMYDAIGMACEKVAVRRR